MKTPERVLTEYAVGEITFDSGIPGSLHTTFTRDGFADLVWYIKHLAYDSSYDPADDEPSSRLAELDKRLCLSDLSEDFRKIRFLMERAQRPVVQRRAWLDAFCTVENLSCYESKAELQTALYWIYVRGIHNSLSKCEFPGPTDWLSQSKVAAAHEVAEFNELVK